MVPIKSCPQSRVLRCFCHTDQQILQWAAHRLLSQGQSTAKGQGRPPGLRQVSLSPSSLILPSPLKPRAHSGGGSLHSPPSLQGKPPQRCSRLLTYFSLPQRRDRLPGPLRGWRAARDNPLPPRRLVRCGFLPHVVPGVPASPTRLNRLPCVIVFGQSGKPLDPFRAAEANTYQQIPPSLPSNPVRPLNFWNLPPEVYWNEPAECGDDFGVFAASLHRSVRRLLRPDPGHRCMCSFYIVAVTNAHTRGLKSRRNLTLQCSRSDIRHGSQRSSRGRLRPFLRLQGGLIP